MSVAEVSAVLGGSWTRSVEGEGTCSYRSNRGAVFVISPIEDPPADEEPALAEARTANCATPPRDVPGTGGAFVCIERPPSGDVVEGNIVAQGYFWLVVAEGQGADPAYPAQSDAIAALLAAVRR
jgi:hypothetical protein